MKKNVIIAVLAALLAATAWTVYHANTTHATVSRVRMERARIADIRAMVSLCSLDFYEDVPVKGHVGPKHLFAKATLRGTVSFDLEKLSVSEHGDTLTVSLPAPTVEVLESNEPGAYRIIDTWSERWTDGIFTSAKLTAAEENAIKAKSAELFETRIRQRGYTERARREAAANLRTLLSALYPTLHIEVVN